MNNNYRLWLNKLKQPQNVDLYDRKNIPQILDNNWINFMLSLPFLLKPTFAQNTLRRSFAISKQPLKSICFFRVKRGSLHSSAANRNVKLMLCFSSLLSMLCCAEESKEVVIKMVSVENFSRERCVSVGAGGKVTYRFEAPSPVDFNIHYHTEKHTDLIIDKKQITSISNDFTSKATQEYCFTWVNKAERGDEWEFVFTYKITP